MFGVPSARAGGRGVCAEGDPDGGVHVGGWHRHAAAAAVLGGLGLDLPLLLGALLPLALLLVRPQLVPVELRRGDALPHAVLAPAMGPDSVQLFFKISLVFVQPVFIK